MSAPIKKIMTMPLESTNTYEGTVTMTIKKLIIVTDASCIVPNANKKGRSGKGTAACGAIFMKDKKNLEFMIGTQSKYLGHKTVPEAEYGGVIFALDCASRFCTEEIELWLDSELVVKQLNGEYKLKANNLRPLYSAVRNLEQRFKSVTYRHHRREDITACKTNQIARQCLRRKKTRRVCDITTRRSSATTPPQPIDNIIDLIL